MSIQGGTRSTLSFDIEAGPEKNGTGPVSPQLITSRLDLGKKLEGGHKVRHAMRPAISEHAKGIGRRSFCEASAGVP